MAVAIVKMRKVSSSLNWLGRFGGILSHVCLPSPSGQNVSGSPCPFVVGAQEQSYYIPTRTDMNIPSICIPCATYMI